MRGSSSNSKKRENNNSRLWHNFPSYSVARQLHASFASQIPPFLQRQGTSWWRGDGVQPGCRRWSFERGRCRRREWMIGSKSTASPLSVSLNKQGLTKVTSQNIFGQNYLSAANEHKHKIMYITRLMVIWLSVG